MTARILDGTKMAAEIRSETAAEVRELAASGTRPGLAVVLVGHNPGFEDLVERLTGSHDRMPTAALACIEFQIDRWEDVEDGKGRLAWLVTPKQVAGPND